MNAAQLKASILQQAIEGKLVFQLPEEGVVEQIGDAPSEVPFAIPESWKWLKLDAIGFWKAGATPSRSVKEYFENGTIPWLKTGDLTDGAISRVEENITQDALDSCSAHINPSGSVLIAMYGATIGKLGVLEMDCATNQACCACQVNSSLINNWYLFYYLLSQRNNFIAKGVGGAQPNISKAKIIVYPVPLPPLAEQKRIVAKIEELMLLVEEYGNAYDKLQELNDELPGKLKASILQEAIQGKLVPQLPEDGVVNQIGYAPAELPFDIPHTWTSCILFDVAELITDGSHNPPPNTGSGIPVLSAKDLSNGLLTADKASRWTDEEHWTSEFKRCPLQMDDIVLCIVGSIGKVGRVKVETKAILQRSLALIRVKESIITKDFFELFLNSLFCQKWLVKGSAGTAQKGIYLRSLRNLPVVIPPLAEQKRIVAKVEALFEQIDLMSK